MTQNQRICIFMGLKILVAMWLFAPYLDHRGYSDESGYFFLFYSEDAHHIDFARLIAQSVVVSSSRNGKEVIDG
jgi:hypothetical protein